MADLFVPGNYLSSAGYNLDFKIECDVMSERELKLCAELMITRLWSGVRFGHVVAVPPGRGDGRDNAGILAQYARWHLKRYDPDPDLTLVVDDVLTTGRSMEVARQKEADRGQRCLGSVIFARGSFMHWIKPWFTLNPSAW